MKHYILREDVEKIMTDKIKQLNGSSTLEDLIEKILELPTHKLPQTN